MREIILEHGSVVLDIDGDQHMGTMLDKHGAQRDRFSIVKDQSVTPTQSKIPGTLNLSKIIRQIRWVRIIFRAALNKGSVYSISPDFPYGKGNIRFLFFV